MTRGDLVARPGSGDQPAQSAGSRAYSRLRSDIVTGAIAEGTRLTETRLAEALGMSRTPVREAMVRLAREGLIERGPGYSTRVAAFPTDEIDEIFEIRVLLETFAARRAAERASADEAATLKRYAAAISARVAADGDAPGGSADDLTAIAEANEAFHRVLHQAARAPRLTALLSLSLDVAMVSRTYRAYTAADLERSAAHHHEMVDAIVARAPDWAASVMGAHVRAAQAVARRAFSGGP